MIESNRPLLEAAILRWFIAIASHFTLHFTLHSLLLLRSRLRFNVCCTVSRPVVQCGYRADHCCTVHCTNSTVQWCNLHYCTVLCCSVWRAREVEWCAALSHLSVVITACKQATAQQLSSECSDAAEWQLERAFTELSALPMQWGRATPRRAPHIHNFRFSSLLITVHSFNAVTRTIQFQTVIS